MYVSGSYFQSHAKSTSQTVFFFSDMIGWITDRNADKSHRIRSLRKLIDSARANSKFLILCGYNSVFPRFYEYLKIAYINEETPEIKEMKLKSPS